MTNGFLSQGKWQYNHSSRTLQALLFISSRTYLAKTVPESSGIKIRKTKKLCEIMTLCTIEFIELVQIFRWSKANILFLLKFLLW